MVEDLRQLVLQLGYTSINLVGHDLGAIVAYVYAALYPAEVRRLVILESPMLGVPSATLDRVLTSYWHMNLYVHAKMPELLIAGREREYLEGFFRTYLFEAEAFSVEDYDEYGDHLASPGGLGGLVGVYRAIFKEIPELLKHTATRLPMPVLALGGEHSMGEGPIEQFRQLANHAQGGTLPGCAHWLVEEQPAALTVTLQKFLT